MKTVEETLEHLLAQCKPIQTVELIGLPNLLGRILSSSIRSDIAVPTNRVSMMDGYALNIDDLNDNNSFEVSQRILAGSIPKKLKPNTVARIFTGANIPQGANCIVMQENVELSQCNKIIKMQTPVLKDQYIRKAGSSIDKGQIILEKGQCLRPQDIGLIASIGLSKVEVYIPLKIATFTTGSELLEPGQPEQTGKIYNSNRYMLNTLLDKLGCELIDFGIVKDDLNTTVNIMQKASKIADVIITTGGVSVGDEDYIKPAVNKLGRLDLWKVKMKPGKPLAYGYVNKTPFIGLPGNPVSAFTTFVIFAKPYLHKKQGGYKTEHKITYVKSNFNYTKPTFRKEFARASLLNINNETVVDLFHNQDSGVLVSTVWADGLVVIPEDTIIKKGDTIAFYHIN